MTHSQDEDQFPNVTQEDCKTSVKISIYSCQDIEMNCRSNLMTNMQQIFRVNSDFHFNIFSEQVPNFSIEFDFSRFFVEEN